MDRSVNVESGELNFSALSTYRNAIYGVAAIWIVLFHGIILPRVKLSSSLQFVTDTWQLGNISVDIFLLLSGIGLYYSFSKDPNILRFYYKRLMRVYLPYLLIAVPVFVYVCFFWYNKPLLFIKALFTVNFWTGDRNPLEFWYVSAILVFYLIYPLIYKFIFCKPKNALLRTILLVVLSIALTFALFEFKKDVYSFLDRVLPRLSVFIIGCYAGKPVKEKRSYSVLFIIAACAIIAGAYPLYARHGLSGAIYRYYGSLTGIAVTFVLSQVFVVLSKLKIDRFFAFFGNFSLEIYISTISARSLYMSSPLYTDNLLTRYLLISAGAMVLAYLIYLLQKPILKALMKPVRGDRQSKPLKHCAS